MDCRKLFTEEEMMKECLKHGEIMLYGCGRVGQTLMRRLNQKGIRIKGFIVTAKNETESSGVPVYSVDEIRGEAFVVVATTEKFHEEILMEIRHRGIEHAACISDVLYENIKNKIKHPREKLMFSVHIVEHCNLNCRGCYHFSSIAAEEYLKIEEYEKDMQRLGELFHGEMEEIFIMGGEPLLHPEVEKFFEITRRYFPIGKIKMLSNGILLENMTDKFWNIVNETETEIWVTKYPVNLDWARIEEIALDKGIKIHYFNEEPVRTLGHQPIDITGGRDYVANFDGCYRANQCILLEQGKIYTCFVSAESRHFNKFFGMELSVSKEDYTDIYEVESGRELLENLTKPTPFCRYCNRNDVDVFGRMPWETTRRRMEEWTE